MGSPVSGSNSRGGTIIGATGAASGAPEAAPVAPMMVPPLEFDPDTGLPITPTPVVQQQSTQDPQSERFGYNPNRGQTSWIIGRNDRFGIVSLESLATLETGEARGFVA